jgi:hypothetical protein
METMYERIKRMPESEMKQFVYWVYLCGCADGAHGLEDSPSGYFGGRMIDFPAKVVMPNDKADDFWEHFDRVYKSK